MHTFIDYKGKSHPLSYRGHKNLIDAFGNADVPNLDEAKFLIRLLQQQTRPLDKRERDKLIACDLIVNINRSLDLMFPGRNWQDTFKFVDQIHHNKHTAECGCQVEFMFNHYNRMEADKPIHWNAFTPCKEHAVRYGQDNPRRSRCRCAREPFNCECEPFPSPRPWSSVAVEHRSYCDEKASCAG